MAKEVADLLEKPEINKYFIKLDDDTVLLVNGKDRASAISLLCNSFKDNFFEKYDFSMYRVQAEIGENGSIAKYFLTEDEEE